MPRSVLLVILLTATLVGCGDEGEVNDQPGSSYRAQAAHVHGVAVNPRDESLLIATHSGLFRAPEGKLTAERVGSNEQDIMGLAVAGPDHLYGSGHPAAGAELPPNLGLIESEDAGESWREVSLLGRADFHVLRVFNKWIYGFDGVTGQLMTSSDRGFSWRRSNVPAPIVDLAVNPSDPRVVLASTQNGLFEKKAAGDWKRLGGKIGYLAWPSDGPLYVVEADGKVSLSHDRGRTWIPRSKLAEAPVATNSFGKGLYVALVNGTVVQSMNRAATWTTRVRP